MVNYLCLDSNARATQLSQCMERFNYHVDTRIYVRFIKVDSSKKSISTQGFFTIGCEFFCMRIVEDCSSYAK